MNSECLQTDAGAEFFGAFAKELERQGIQHKFSRQRPNKSHAAELINKLLKGYIRKFRRERKTKRFLAHLPDFVRSLNCRKLERLGGLEPVEVHGMRIILI
ncbi:MAG: hypothetical protein GY820_01955 [Gammaproteobacteria bacterium]|nr:hypothetical protein [Gammaproteobacteria bacterium]